MFECAQCRTIWVAPPLTIDLKNFYENQYDYSSYSSINELTPFHRKIIHFDRKVYLGELKALISFLPKNALILDVGCGIPFFLYFAKISGYHVVGCDMASGIIDYSMKTLKVPIVSGTIKNLALSEKRFDMIRYNHVFEHIPFPNKELEFVRKLLKTGGILRISVPNVLNWKFNIKKNLRLVDPQAILNLPEHVVMYSEQGITELLKRYGFILMKRLNLLPHRIFACKETIWLYYIESLAIPHDRRANLDLLFVKKW